MTKRTFKKSEILQKTSLYFTILKVRSLILYAFKIILLLLLLEKLYFEVENQNIFSTKIVFINLCYNNY